MSRRAVTGEVRRYALNMKTTESLRRLLEREAERTGRTLSHEVEYRLEKSVDKDEAYGGAISVEIMDQLGSFLKMFSMASKFEQGFGTNALARAALKAAFNKIVDEALPISVGLMHEPVNLAPGEIEAYEDASRRIVDAILANAMLKQFASLRGKAGELAPEPGETLLDWAKRTDFWKRTADTGKFSEGVDFSGATEKRNKGKKP